MLIKSLVGLLLTCCFVAVAQAQETADLVLTNGKVFTADSGRPAAQAVAIRGDRILAVGTTAEIDRLASSQTRRIDLRGRVVIPGINDAHYHFSPTHPGVRLQFKTMEPSWNEVREALASAMQTARADEWILGSVGHAIVLNAAIDRQALDALTSSHPVLLTAYYGHGYVANTRALRRLGIANDEADPLGGWFERERGTQQINGRLWEYAQWRPARLLAEEVTTAQALADLRRMADEAARFGITSMQIFSTLPIEHFSDLLVQAKLPIRVRAIPFPLTTAAGRDLGEIRQLGHLATRNPNVTASGIKWVLDGTPFEHGAFLRSDYLDRRGWRGRLNFPPAEITRMLDESLRFDQQLLVHAVGDGAIDLVLTAMDRNNTQSWPARRLRFEHGDGLVSDLVPRVRRLGVVVVQNPTHFTDAQLFRERWGSDKQPLKSLLDAGVHVALGSDGAMNPYLNVMFATIHPANALEAITREQALRAYTAGSAYAEFQEKNKGVIGVGMLADLAVLSQDIFAVPPNALPATHSVLTIVGGNVVHEGL